VISPDLAFLFPGQGAHRPAMLEEVLWHPAFAQRHDAVATALGQDLIRKLRDDPQYINRNVVSSLLTALVSSLAHDAYQDEHGETAARVAGYSVGQWTALYAAGCLSFEALVEVIVERARCLDACNAKTPGAMMAVIGVGPEPVREFCAELRHEGHQLYLSNDNCIGQYSLAGTAAAIDLAMRRIARLQPKRVVRLSVAGAWHCPLVAPAATTFGDWLASRPLAPPCVAVVSNVTGEWLPADSALAQRELVDHLAHPVLWARCVRTLVAAGSKRYVELGSGNVLTKFGFFIDRSVAHRAYSGAR
jgi:[acyl-carrier-protein] S-malonyltransferase